MFAQEGTCDDLLLLLLQLEMLELLQLPLISSSFCLQLFYLMIMRPSARRAQDLVASLQSQRCSLAAVRHTRLQQATFQARM